MNHDPSFEQRLKQLETQLELLSRALGVDVEDSPAPAAMQHTTRLLQAVERLAPLRPLLEAEEINDILINSDRSIYVERLGRLEKAAVQFENDEEVFKLAEEIVSRIGRSINPQRPLVDARLPDGSRVNIIAPPLSVDGTIISIRKFSKHLITVERLVAQKNCSAALGEFLKVVGKCRLNIIISGGTGSGKTTLLNAISQHIEPSERIVTIEDAAELKLQQPHVVRLESKPISFGRRREEEVTIRDLVKNALRMRPDRIIVGEVRGAEAFDMMQAMNTGHEGSLTTVHANHPRDAIARLENMMNMANLNLPSAGIRAQVASAIHLIIQISRMRDGHRRITHVSEVVGMESDIITMQDLFSYHTKGEDKDGTLIGEFRWSGIMPRFLRRVAYYGEADRLAQALNVRLPSL
jgi:pilus assembly protein CpaF